jgi:3-hydroxypropanoate dehydrogenase
MIPGRLSDAVLDQLLLQARTQNAWQSRAVPDETLKAIFNLMRMGPTSANMQPARLVFVQSTEGKERLKPCLSEGNREKTMAAPVCTIIGYDTRFYEYMPKVFPHEPDARSWFDHDQHHAETHAFRNSSLQGAYFIIAARALGLDCGPMSGFDAGAVEKAFFPDGRVRANFLCNIGYGDPKGVFPRSPRFEFEEVCTIV